jgi:hypothetical protein
LTTNRKLGMEETFEIGLAAKLSGLTVTMVDIYAAQR